MSDKKASNQMWGGRFASGPAAIMEAINASIGFDKKLYAQDIRGSVAHSEMLAETGIISAGDQQKIAHGLNTILREIEDGKFAFSTRLEDIHMNVESRLAELIGASAGRLHTARSRNDQVAVDFRLWVKDEFHRVAEALKGLIAAFLERAEQHASTVMPGFTHLQTAQPVTFGHHCMAYVEMFARDLSRVRDAIERMNESPLGAAALAGTGFPIDRFKTAKALGFREPTRNSLDSVSDRDYALEFLSIAAICATHMSRLAEEIVIWSTPQFGFVRLSDSFSTGSSIMPQKKNPDAAELVRAKTGRVNGHLIGLLTVMKGLPLTYSKDMQEDKEAVFDAAETLDLMLAAMTGMVGDMTINEQAMKKAAGSGYSTATDLADWLVRTLGMPFREAHHVTGRAVALAESKKVGLEKLALEDLKSIHDGITDDIFSVLSVQNSVKSRTSFGGTAPAEVKKQVRYWKKRLAKA
ncbi:argininosuccinate lyase [Aminobacter sp. NyZ550]|jgi:argininosuccinate lyase|uniref:Argininosuccinate lyase n=2 Tax=Aminobacter TaxID=31988 RepID=A0AAC8YLT5_AMIAI|nr:MULTISPECIES: argininosuccinate lyase [Aminobacter]AMS40683.1 argininosuccinate lyase [Aminobacter aminovorans]MBA8908519.1 argininosuccinate lyase [Aminobacter ciceronei]MBA9022308.1 argininosuccinate lyase [Aminobacter ciceronei]MBB3706377.1 argininosuccinate lyase [Aminobacter aminovorans]MRX35165.1 argininosuccinate lyase [Aminobacter sp. MDW-2]